MSLATTLEGPSTKKETNLIEGLAEVRRMATTIFVNVQFKKSETKTPRARRRTWMRLKRNVGDYAAREKH